MGAIVKCLSDVKNIGEGRTEEMPLGPGLRVQHGSTSQGGSQDILSRVLFLHFLLCKQRLALVVRQLERLLLAPGDTGIWAALNIQISGLCRTFAVRTAVGFGMRRFSSNLGLLSKRRQYKCLPGCRRNG